MSVGAAYVVGGLAVVALVAVVTYDARGRVWHGWSDAKYWTVLTVCVGFLALPFYLLARTRTTKKVPAAAGTTGSQPAAGWYRDPSGEGDLRYWDGRTWTDQTAERPRSA